MVVAHRDVLHKIGVTGGDVARRIANAKLDPTFLMADVQVVATYRLFNINRTKLENLIHRVFGRARVDIEVRTVLVSRLSRVSGLPSRYRLLPRPSNG